MEKEEILLEYLKGFKEDTREDSRLLHEFIKELKEEVHTISKKIDSNTYRLTSHLNEFEKTQDSFKNYKIRNEEFQVEINSLKKEIALIKFDLKNKISTITEKKESIFIYIIKKYPVLIGAVVLGFLGADIAFISNFIGKFKHF